MALQFARGSPPIAIGKAGKEFAFFFLAPVPVTGESRISSCAGRCSRGISSFFWKDCRRGQLLHVLGVCYSVRLGARIDWETRL